MSGGSFRYWRIGILSALMLAAVFTGGNMLLSGIGAARQRPTGEGETPSLASETGVFRLSPHAARVSKVDGSRPARFTHVESIL